MLTLFATGPLGPIYPANAVDKPYTLDVGDFTIYLPVVSDPHITYLYDLIGGESLIGGETTLLGYKDRILLAGGVVADASGEGNSELKDQSRSAFNGIPFIGLNFNLPIFDDLVGKRLLFGGFYARDFDAKENLAGFKANISVRFW